MPTNDTPRPQAVDYSGQPLAEGDTVAFIGTDPVCLRQGRIRVIGPNDLCIESGAQLVLFPSTHAGWAETPARPLGGKAVPNEDVVHVRAYPHVALQSSASGTSDLFIGDHEIGAAVQADVARHMDYIVRTQRDGA
jgi:hypothetical protein